MNHYLTQSYFINTAYALYSISLLLFIISYFRWKETLQKGIIILFSIAAVLQTAELLVRWVLSHHPPLSGMYESLLLFSWASIISYLILLKFYRIISLSIFVLIIEILFLGFANLQDKSPQPLIPVLKSNWLIVHVFVYMLGYGLMAIAFFTALSYYYFKFQIKDREEKIKIIEKEIRKETVEINAQKEKKLNEIEELTQTLDTITYKIVKLGFPLITLGLITGAVWANRTWGSYWSWDPKETAALVTWCIYAIYLHLRYIKKWQTISNLFPILGFLAVLCTFLLLKYLPAASGSLHVYQ